ncbi:PA14 domain-containing protein [Spirosoma endophyticum]|uniref:Por secretion system C-terminal sorting domain-containing protein n=1 Tax=Spirosoma endophyticum TaxID=662367 RepID=A0A1I2HBH9_9BACT|nr:PA14 domain-containing protein [Spirosoma endophyticum]SFF26733.1 Por secretion system C-terminal sorting domain-containing protein [Spirosoma endophyticum]
MKSIYLAAVKRIWYVPPVFLLILSNLSTSFGQTTYYVANAGNDSNDGRSTSAPFQSIAKINSLSLQPGDQVLFRRSDTFRGNLQLRQSGSPNNPIVIDAYGSGNKPVLAGSVPVSNWKNLGNNVWQADCPSCGDRVTGLYRDNSALPLGRYPNADASNKGYLTVQSHAGKSQLTSQQSLSTNWTGGEAVFRPVQWILNRAAITGQNGNTLSLDGSGTYDISDNWGYFIQNHPATLDQAGEWYYSPATKKIQVYDTQSSPNGHTITATVFSEAVNLSNVSNVTIRNVQITQAVACDLLITNGSNLVITNNDITQSGEDGILLKGSGSQVLLENNLIEDINNNGVDISPYQNVTFRGNTIRRIGLFAGRGKSGDGTYVGFQSATTANTLIENNVLDNIGYNALNFSNSTTVQRNQISNFCLTKSDGSGLYIWNGNQQAMSDIRLLSNVVYNGIGAPEGTLGGAYSGANGIYLDDCTTNIEVTGNSVYNCRGLGFFLHGSSNIKMTGNTSYNNGEGQFAITSAGGCQPRNNLVQSNIFVSRLATQFNVKYESSQNDLAGFGQFDNNVYARPFEDVYTIRAVYNSTTGADISLSDWQNRYGKDPSTRTSPVTYSSGNPDDYLKFTANQTANAIQISLDGTYRDARNNVVTGQVTVPAFSSLILFKDVVASTPLRTADNPANAVAGLDYGYYESYWTSLPDFTTLTPVKTGVSSTPTIAVRNRDDSFGLRFIGYVSVPTDGTYTFYTNSDDGSKLLIGTTEVVNNDGGHATQERSGTIGLKAGLHALTVLYFEGGGDQTLSVSYSGPGLSKQVIPASALWHVAANPAPQPPAVTLRNADNPANAVAGLDYGYYEGNWSNLPDFNTLTSIKTGISSTPALGLRNRDNNYGIRFVGYVSVPTDGVYTFYSSSDDGTKLLIGSTEVVNNDGGHGDQERSGTIGLKAGLHALSVLYLQIDGGQALRVSYSGPGINKQEIPASSLWRVAINPAPQPPAVTLRDADNPANAVAGLDYGYYESYWTSLPDFTTLTPVKTGVSSTPTIAVRSRDDSYGLRFKGYVSVPADGVYTFYTSSDDGTKLLIGTTEVVNNDGVHGEQERSGTIGLKAGLHALTIVYFNGGGGQALTVNYSGPGLSKQAIPASAFWRVATSQPTPAPPAPTPPSTASNSGTGLRADYFNNNTLTAPYTLTRTDATVDFFWGDGTPATGVINTDNFSARWTGQVEAPVTGTYIFSTDTDDGVRLWVNRKLLINDWNGHPSVLNNGTAIDLVAGQRYDIQMDYFEYTGGATARLGWAYPGQSLTIIPKERLYPTTISLASARVAATEEQSIEVSHLQAYPVPARESIWVRYNAAAAGEATLQLINTAAQPVHQTIHQVIPGENIIKVMVDQLGRGTYVLVLTQSSKRLTRKVILTD